LLAAPDAADVVEAGFFLAVAFAAGPAAAEACAAGTSEVSASSADSVEATPSSAVRDVAPGRPLFGR